MSRHGPLQVVRLVGLASAGKPWGLVDYLLPRQGDGIKSCVAPATPNAASRGQMKHFATAGLTDRSSAATRSLGCNDSRLAASAARVLDLGCGEGRLLQALLKEWQFTEIVGMDVSHRALEIASDRLHYDRLPPKQKERIRLLHGSLIYRDHRFEWKRTEFQAWANAVAARFGYNVRFLPVGPEDSVVGSPTLMGIFERK